MTDIDLAGLWVPIITPFDRRGDVDLASLRRLADRLLDDGAAGLVALGTTGEPATLTDHERRAVVDICDEACRRAGRGLIVGAGSNATASTVTDVRVLDEWSSVIAALVVVPYYTRPSERGVVDHFRTVAEASPVPIVLYNVPYRTGITLGSSAIIELSRHDRIVGIKQAVGALDADTLRILAEVDRSFGVLSGDDAFIAPTILMGGVGAIAASGHVATDRFVALIDSARAGDVRRASALAADLLPIVEAGFTEPNPAVFKAVLARRGEISTSELRSPMMAASETAADALADALRRGSSGGLR